MNRGALTCSAMGLFVSAAACAPGVSPPPPTPGQESLLSEELRAHLAAHQALIPRDEKYGTARAMANHIRVYSMLHLTKCGLVSVYDAPTSVNPHAVNTFAVDVSEGYDERCTSFRDPVLCSALRGNCMAVDYSIFCDYGYLLKLKYIANTAYAWGYIAEQQPTGLPILPPVGKDTQLELLDLDTRLQAFDNQLGPVMDFVRTLARGKPSMVNEYLEFALLGTRLGHELAHVEEYSCGSVARADSQSDELIEKYTEVMCLRANPAELRADARGLVLPKALGAVLDTFIQKGWSDEDPPALKLWASRNMMRKAMFSLAAEQDAFERLGKDVVVHEPDIDAKDFIPYYMAVGSRLTAEELSGSAVGHHMASSYRSAVLMAGDWATEHSTSDSDLKLAGSRFAPMLWGAVFARQTEGCHRDEKQALAIGLNTVETVLPGLIVKGDGASE